jgi:hypothetical protein
MKLWVPLVLGLIVGCSTTDNGHTTRVVNRPMTENDTPFGGGSPPSQRPDGDPFGRAGTRDMITVQHGADNGAPETRIGGGQAPDARIK